MIRWIIPTIIIWDMDGYGRLVGIYIYTVFVTNQYWVIMGLYWNHCGIVG